MVKIIFLDFNGVMMCGKHAFPSEHHEGFAFNPGSVENLRAVIDETHAKIVMTSTYRRFATLENLKQRFFAPYGLDSHFMDVTSSLKGGRGVEIRDYLDNHQIENFVIFDDLPIHGFAERFIQIHPFEGITERDKNRAIQILNEV